MEKLFEQEDYSRHDEIQRTRKEQERLETRKANLQNDLMDRTFTPQDYQDMKGRVGKELVLLKDKLTDLQQQTSPFKIYIRRKCQCLRTSWNITGSQTVLPGRRSSVAS